VIVHPTSLERVRAPDSDKRIEFQALYQELVEDEHRNGRICDDVIESVRGGRSPLVLTEGADRARSATEAFLYRRLETLPETTGRFRVNAALPIAFDGLGRLEVDLLCDDARVAVDLDGAQHLADPVAYRRDRRKDQLLQENG
jgi:hypothetical protein